MQHRYSPLEIVFQNEDLVAINKPHGLLVHRSRLAADVNIFALQILRDQIGLKVYPAHRLDRKTSGVLLFSKSEKANQEVQAIFREGKVIKKYLAIVRGYTGEQDIIDYPLVNNLKSYPAKTHFRNLARFELAIPSAKFPTSRYSLLEITPFNGRYHQIRKHLAHIFHPIIGDRPHGCNKQNRFWKDRYSVTTMMLHAASLEFHLSGFDKIEISAAVSPEFTHMLNILKSDNIGLS